MTSGIRALYRDVMQENYKTVISLAVGSTCISVSSPVGHGCQNPMNKLNHPHPSSFQRGVNPALSCVCCFSAAHTIPGHLPPWE
uniref:KRAB domain-containing protein n=1 Tax=Chelydra serpentina TaxID=8475 RepID=A0A8C3XM07_CHESE